MAGAVLADQAGPIDADDDGRVVLADVVDDLVEGPLQEGRVEGHHGPLASQRQADGHGHGVLLGDADVVDAPGEPLAEGGHAGARGHACRDRHHPLIRLGDAHELRGHDRRVVGGLPCGAGTFARGGGGVAVEGHAGHARPRREGCLPGHAPVRRGVTVRRGRPGHARRVGRRRDRAVGVGP